MSSVLGVYWAPGHQRQSDIDYMRQLQPPAIRVLDPDPNQLAIAHQAAPNALLLPRDWSLSEQHDDARNDPVGTGKRHAQDWRGKIDRWRSMAQLPPDNQIVVVGLNEPRVWDMLPQVVDYTVAMLDECTRLGLRACALNLSVGWPANTGPDTKPDWTPYKPIEPAIKRGNHILVLHSYWYKSGPQDGAGWWAWRHHHCPWDVPIIVGECGVDNYVDIQRWENDGKPNRGWRGNLSPEQYAAQMEQYARGCDRRVVAILPFLTDYRSNIWESFDTAEAHPHLLARKDNMIPQVAAPSTPTTPPHSVHIPAVGTGAPSTVAYVVAPSGANLRSTPTTATPDNIIMPVAYGKPVQVYGAVEGTGEWSWAIVQYGGQSGYIREDLLGGKPADVPTQPQEPTPTGDNWQRSRAFVAKWEGEFQDFDWDAGNWTGCAPGEGIKKGTKYGISACSYPNLDIRNITMQQADEIYFRDYWQRSGADRLPWPYCLIALDTAVLHGADTAENWLAEYGEDVYAFVARRLKVYTKSKSWDEAGRAWVNRVADLLLEASKP